MCKIADAIKIIDYKYKMKLQQIKNKKDFQEDDIIKKSKSKK